MIDRVLKDTGIDWSHFEAKVGVFTTYVRLPLLHMAVHGGDRYKYSFEGILAALERATGAATRFCYYARWHDQAVLDLESKEEPSDILWLFDDPAQESGDTAALLTDNSSWLFAVLWSRERELITIEFGGSKTVCDALKGVLGDA